MEEKEGSSRNEKECRRRTDSSYNRLRRRRRGRRKLLPSNQCPVVVFPSRPCSDAI
jgi:hypothetical protein